MPPRILKTKKPEFLVACELGDTQEIQRLFGITSPDLYNQGLTFFISFLEKHPHKKNDYIKIRDYQKILIIFSSRLDLYDWDFIADKIRKLSNKYLPAAKTLFRSFLKKMLMLYILAQAKKEACSRFPVSTCQELSAKKLNDFLAERAAHHVMIHYPILRLFYQSRKNNKIKHFVDLGRQHIALKASLPEVTAGNVATVAFTFMLKVSRPNKTDKQYIEVTLPLTIPTHASLDNIALHFDQISDSSRSYKPYEKLKILFEQGLSFFKVKEKKHGHHPEYNNLDKARAADSIKHSEQALALYLYEEEHVEALVTQLSQKLHQIGDRIRAGDRVKVIAVVLHLHSSKTPCAVCETVLTGLMDRENGAFLQRLKNVLSKNQGVFNFYIPKTGVRLHVLYSADAVDADHKENRHEDIDTVTEHAMRKKSGVVFCSLFKHGRTLDYEPFISHDEKTPNYTVLGSGGSSSEKTRGTNAKINAKHQKSLYDLLTCQKQFREQIGKEADIKIQAELLAKYEEFKNWLFEEHGIQTADILGDGNCQFTAIAVQLLQVYPDGLSAELAIKISPYDGSIEGLAKRLRALAAEYMHQNRAMFEPYIDAGAFALDWTGATDFDAYIAYIKINKKWGGEQTLRALANVLELPVFVLHPIIMRHPNHIMQKIYLPTGKTLNDFIPQEWLVINHNGLNHYDTISDRPSLSLIELVENMIYQPSQLGRR